MYVVELPLYTVPSEQVKIGDGTHIFKLDSKVKNNPPEWKLDFPEGEVWLVQQTQG